MTTGAIKLNLPTVTLDESNHTYWLEGRQLQSVGSLVKRLTPKFDAEAQAVKSARRYGVTPEEMLRQWADKRDKAADKGHFVHGAIHRALTGTTDWATVRNWTAPMEFHVWVRWWEAASRFLKPLALETIVGDSGLGYAGTLDTLLYSTKTLNLHIFDWKTNERYETENKYGDTMLPPFQDLPACRHTEHSLQVSLYAIILEGAGYKVGPGWILHLSPQRATPHKAIDLRQRALAWVRRLDL